MAVSATFDAIHETSLWATSSAMTDAAPVLCLIRTARATLVPASAVSETSCAAKPPAYAPLGAHCPLFARKFLPELLPALQAHIADCPNSVYSTPSVDCVASEAPAPAPADEFDGAAVSQQSADALAPRAGGPVSRKSMTSSAVASD